MIDNQGIDVTEEYKYGASLTLAKLKELSITQIIMKEKSPSCGSCAIYDGTFSGKIKDGTGVAAALFQMNGIKIISEFTI